jgi:LmbE family N-acetylglucosaminyl deacetylase
MSLRLLIIGAHPDDADYAAGGTAALYRVRGHVVRMVSLTNGDAGHHEQSSIFTTVSCNRAWKIARKSFNSSGLSNRT